MQDFEQVYRTYFTDVYRYVLSLCRNEGIAEEVTQQAFFEALQANTDELEKMKADVDEEYAYEKLRLKAERVTGMHIEYLFEKDAIAAQLSGRTP